MDDPKFLRAKSLPEYSSRDPYKVRADDKENTSQFFRVRQVSDFIDICIHVGVKNRMRQ